MSKIARKSQTKVANIQMTKIIGERIPSIARTIINKATAGAKMTIEANKETIKRTIPLKISQINKKNSFISLVFIQIQIYNRLLGDH